MFLSRLKLIFLAFAATVSVHAQQANPHTNVKWSRLTGAGSPTASCTSANYGEPYDDVGTSPVTRYKCTPTGWSKDALFGDLAASAVTIPNNDVDVRSYGAKCDGVTNDSAAFSRAIEAANGSTAIVQIPAGTCAVNLTIGPALGLTLQGRGVYATTLIPASNAPVITINSGVVPSNGVQNLTFRSFAVNNANNYTSNAFLMYGLPQNVRKTFEDIAINAQARSTAFVNPILNRGFSIWDTYIRVNIYNAAGDAVVYNPGTTVSLTGFSIDTNSRVSTVTFTNSGRNNFLAGTQFEVTGFSTNAGTALNHMFFVVTQTGASTFRAETGLCLYNGTNCTLQNTFLVTDSGTASPKAFYGGLTFQRSTVQGATGRCLYIDSPPDDSAPFASGLLNIGVVDSTMQQCAGGVEINNANGLEISNSDFEGNGTIGISSYNLILGGSYAKGVGIHGNTFVQPGGTGSTGASIQISAQSSWGISIHGNLIWAPPSGYTIAVNQSTVDSQKSNIEISGNYEIGNHSYGCDLNGACGVSSLTPLILNTESFNAGTQTTTPSVAQFSRLHFINPGTFTVTNFRNGTPGQEIEISCRGTGTLTLLGSNISGPLGNVAYPISCSPYERSLSLYQNNNGVWIIKGNPDAAPFNAVSNPLPVCASTSKGVHAAVTDANAPTFLGAYSSGGTVFSPVICNGINWVTY